MNEFNPFDDLWITFDDDNNLKESRRDRNYQNPYNPFDEDPDIAREANVIPEETPDFSQPLVKEQNLKDLQVKQELGITDLPEPMTDDEKQAYVDWLSTEDWKAWKQMRKEWYSFEARQAMMDNKEDMYDISKPGNEKFWSWNKNWIHEQMIESAQGAVDFQTDYIHPWSQSAQEWLQNESDALSTYSYDEIYQELLDKRIDDDDNALVRWLKRQAAKPDAFIKHEASIVWSYAFDIAKKSVDVMEQTTNIITQMNASFVNLFNTGQKGYDMVTVDTSKIPNIYWSYVRAVEDVLGVGFVAKYPIATYLLTTISEKSDLANFVITNVDKWFERCAEQIYEQSGWKDFDMQYLTPEEQQIAQENIKMSIYITTSALMEEGWKKFSESEALQNFQTASQVARRTSRLSRQKAIESLNKTIETVEKIGEGTLENSKWTVLWRVTNWKFSLTTPWALQVWSMLLWESRKWFVKGMEWYYKNKDKWLVTRDPKAPEWELPKPYTDKEWEEKVEEWVKSPEEEVKVKDEIKEPEWEIKEPKTEVKTPEAKTPTTKGKKVETKTEEWTTIWEYIKKINNSITWKKWWLDKDLYEKLSTSKELQSEYVNTIDPYLKSTGWENPSWVIQGQLDDFVKTIESQLTDRRNKNIDFRKGQIKYKVEIPESDKLKWSQEDKEIKDLIKTLRNKNEDPELFLKYLLNLPKEKIAGFNKYIPDFSKNLWLINDTLSLTKAIASKDLLWKFLNFKSTWGTRNKNYIRKYIYKKLNEAYRKAWVKRNMYEIEQMLNQLSEEELVELEETMKDDSIPAYMKQDFINNLYDKLDPKPIEAVEGKKIGESTIQLPKNTRENIINDELVKQWYTRWTNTTPEYKTEKELREHKLQDGTTIGQWMDRTKTHLSPKVFRDFRLSEADFWNKAINYNANGLDMSSFVAWHEIAHFVLGKLTTSELFDLTERIRKLTKDSWKEVNRVWMWEYLADTISNYLNHGNIDWLKNLLTKDLEGPKKEITEHVQNLLENFKKDKLHQERKPRYENPKNQGWITAWERMDFLRKVDPNLKDYSFDLDVDSPTFSEMRFNMKDWKSLSWDEWKDTLSHDQYVKLYSSEDLFNLEKEIKNQSKPNNNWREDIKNEIKDAEAYFGKEKYEKYQKEIKNIDPDIVGLIEKDGQIYVKYLMESQWERWELPNRPGYVEVKEVPAKDYFTEEELNQLPKELKNQILDNEEKDIIQLQKDLDYWHHRAMKAERWSEDPDDYLDLENRKYDENADIEQVQKDIDYRHHRAMVAERGGE